MRRLVPCMRGGTRFPAGSRTTSPCRSSTCTSRCIPRWWVRALITHPRLILADEPTGALDSRSTDELLDLFAQINRQGQTILMVTHSVKAASHAGRVLFIKDGQVFHQLYRGQCTDEQLYQKIADTLTMLQAGGDRA